MKYILVILICFFSLFSYGQVQKQPRSNFPTVVDSSLAIGKNFILPVFRSFSQLATYTALDSTGRLVFIRDSNAVFLRTNQHTWQKLAASTGAGIPGGQQYSVQLNDGSGGFAGDDLFTYNYLTGDITTNNIGQVYLFPEGKVIINAFNEPTGFSNLVLPGLTPATNTSPGAPIGVDASGNVVKIPVAPLPDTTFTGVIGIIVDSANHSICALFSDSSTICYPLGNGVYISGDTAVCFPSGDTAICYSLNNDTLIVVGSYDSITVNGSTYCWYLSSNPGVPTCITLNNNGSITSVTLNSDSSLYEARDIFDNIIFTFPTLLQPLIPGDTCTAIRDTTISGEHYLAIYTNLCGSGGGGSGWLLTGNTGTDPSTDFVGTTDVDTLVFRIANGIAGKITPTNLWFGYGSDINNNTVENVLFGGNAMTNITTGNRNTGIGHNTYQQATTGNDNIAIGDLAGYGITTGNKNIAIGSNALFGSVSVGQDGSEKNIAIGANSLKVIGVSSGIISIGDSSGYNIVNGTGNVYLGNQSTGADAIENATAVGANSYVSQSNSLVLGSINGVNGATATTNVGVNNTAPSSTLELGTGGVTNATFRQTFGSDGYDAVWYSYPLDANILRINGDDNVTLFNEGDNSSWRNIFNGTSGDYNLTIRGTGTLGYGYAQAGIQTGVSESQFSIDNTSNNTSFGLAVTGVGSGLPEGQFYILNRTANTAPFTINGSGNVGIGTTSTDSLLTNELGFLSKRGVRFSGLSLTGFDTTNQKPVVINSSGTLSKMNWPASGSGGVTTLAAIGSSANANGATISGSTLNLEPASASFGGVVTTGTQTFAGAKTNTGLWTFSNNSTGSQSTLFNGFVQLSNDKVGLLVANAAGSALDTTNVHPERISYTLKPSKAGLAIAGMDVVIADSGTVAEDHSALVQTAFTKNSTNTLTNLYNNYGIATLNSGTTTNRYQSYMSDATGSGILTNQYGYYTASLTKGSYNRAFYAAGTTASYFGGNTYFANKVGINATDGATLTMPLTTWNNASGDAGIRIAQTGQNNWDLYNPTGQTYFGIRDVNNSLYMSILTGGNVGINQITQTSKFSVNGNIAFQRRTVTASTASLNQEMTLYCDATSNTQAITAPTPVGIDGRIYVIEKTDASTNAVTITPAAGTIGGASSYVLNYKGDAVTIQSDNSNYQIIGKASANEKEVISTVSTYTNYTTTATYQNITSITLPAGDWDLSAFATFSSNSATVTTSANAMFVISTTTASASGATEGLNINYVPQAALLGSSLQSTAIAPYRVSPTSSTTYYLNTQATFTLGNPQFVGTIRAVKANQ